MKDENFSESKITHADLFDDALFNAEPPTILRPKQGDHDALNSNTIVDIEQLMKQRESNDAQGLK
jgi:hypothetical protein